MKIKLLAFTLVTTIVMASCAAPAAPAPAAPAAPGAPAAPAPAAPSGPDLQIHFGGSSPGGMMFYMVGGFATLVTPHVPGVNITNVTTGAAFDNAIRVGQGDLDLGLTFDVIAYELVTNTGMFAEPQWHGVGDDLMAVAVTHKNDFYFAAFRGSGIESISDINGRTVSTGPPGSGTQFLSNLILDILDLDVNREHLSFADTVFAMREGRVEVLGWAGSPAGAITELAETDDIIIIPWTPEEVQRVVDAVPFFFADYMPPIYRGMDGPVLMPHHFNIFIAHRDMPEQVLYDMLYVAFQPDILEDMALIHSNWSEFQGNTQGLMDLGLEVHPGAVRFFEENPWAPQIR